MKIFRFGEEGSEKPGIIINDVKYDVSSFGQDYDESFLGGDGFERLAAYVEANQSSLPIVADNVRLAPAICRPSKIVCIGLNFIDHAEESGMEPPAEPVVFFKATSSIVGPNDDLVIPKGGDKTDWEVELGVVIGKKASYVSEADALDHVAGYVLHNDYSERAFQLERCGQWVKGKAAILSHLWGHSLQRKMKSKM